MSTPPIVLMKKKNGLKVESYMLNDFTSRVVLFRQLLLRTAVNLLGAEHRRVPGAGVPAGGPDSDDILGHLLGEKERGAGQGLHRSDCSSHHDDVDCRRSSQRPQVKHSPSRYSSKCQLSRFTLVPRPQISILFISSIEFES